MSSFTEIQTTGSTATETFKVLSEVFAIGDEIKENRRWFHANPELGFQEVKTAAYVAAQLRSYGIQEIFESVGKTGVVGLIRGGNGDGPCIALRADMDGLPINETADVEYRSQNDGVMHACGHDGHMSGLLAAAKVLHGQRHTFAGTVKLIFQPAEEGYGGAREMIKDGVLDSNYLGPRVDSIYGIHLWSFLTLGDIGCREGPVMAASDRFKIEVKGKGGHGALPHQSVDAIVEAAAVVTALQTIVSRNKDPLDAGVVSCGTINGGYANNIIADSVVICGTCRSFTAKTQELIKTRMNDICCGVALTYGGEVSVEYNYGYPATVNAYPECNAVVTAASTVFVGAERSVKAQKTMGAEDFSYFLEQRPGCFFFVGAALPGDTRPHHKSVFDFDETAILLGASIYVQIIRYQLGFLEEPVNV